MRGALLRRRRRRCMVDDFAGHVVAIGPVSVIDVPFLEDHAHRDEQGQHDRPKHAVAEDFHDGLSVVELAFLAQTIAVGVYSTNS